MLTRHRRLNISQDIFNLFKSDFDLFKDGVSHVLQEYKEKVDMLRDDFERKFATLRVEHRLTVSSHHED
jgi:hypothetical protein